jgi:hypothetical protein
MYHPLYWRYVLNLLPSVKFSVNKPGLDDSQQTILSKLNKDGIAIFNFEELFGDRTLFNELNDFYKSYQDKYNSEIAEARDNRASNKPYSYTIGDKYKKMTADNPMLRIAGNKRLVDLVNNYLGLLSHLRYCDIWQTFIAESGPIRSQNWHRDPEDFRLVKMFIYLNDVDETAGPFCYAKGSHTKGANFHDPEWFREDGRKNNRSTDEQVAKVVPQDQWVSATGKAGTVILADTRGLHKGGFATHKERILFTSMFVSPSSYYRPTFLIEN